ncbi:CopD family protein [Aureimonas ureilytica]|uniref:CopD family protein n=1 Tax=Aureimonas ureilytica TaxID=401562 RepID=UPI000380CD27|nr:CopD family protein [Aureimonas ureilytica]
MILVWTKALHIATMVIWCGGLLLLPVLMNQREAAGAGPPLHRLHAFTRFAYIVVISPAAFLAIASGTALILLREVFTVWFALKLLFVGVLTGLHVWTGLVILSLFDDDKHFRAWRMVSALVVLSLTLTAILWLVLAKPAVDLALVPDLFQRPGALGEFGRDLIRRLTP